MRWIDYDGVLGLVINDQVGVIVAGTSPCSISSEPGVHIELHPLGVFRGTYTLGWIGCAWRVSDKFGSTLYMKKTYIKLTVALRLLAGCLERLLASEFAIIDGRYCNGRICELQDQY